MMSLQEKRLTQVGDPAVRPKQVTISHPGTSKAKPISKKKPYAKVEFHVEKEFERNKEEGATRLDLTKCSLIVLPSSIRELTHLVEFYLYQNKLVTLPPEIGSLVNLQILAVNE